jgi:hypothetical protein
VRIDQVAHDQLGKMFEFLGVGQQKLAMFGQPHSAGYCSNRSQASVPSRLLIRAVTAGWVRFSPDAALQTLPRRTTAKECSELFKIDSGHAQLVA